MFNNKINMLKALAIMLVVSGHLEFSLIPMFPPYSFHIALFFFISGYLFNEKYLSSGGEFIKKRTRSLLLPYFLYSVFYLIVTIIFAKITGKFWGMPLSFKNFFITPFLNGHQFDLSAPLWFVPQLFISLIVFLFILKMLKKANAGKYICLTVFLILCALSIPLSMYRDNPCILVCIRTMFSLFFIYLGLFYKNHIENRFDIFNAKWFFMIVLLQSLLWLTNKDYTPLDGIGLSYILVWGQFDDYFVPILTSLTGIWASLFLIEIFYGYLKDNKFIFHTGKETFHIMANHLLVFNIITYIILYIKGIPFDIKNLHDIYWLYAPLKTTYIYFVAAMIITAYSGYVLQKINLNFIANKKPD